MKKEDFFITQYILVSTVEDESFSFFFILLFYFNSLTLIVFDNNKFEVCNFSLCGYETVYDACFDKILSRARKLSSLFLNFAKITIDLYALIIFSQQSIENFILLSNTNQKTIKNLFYCNSFKTNISCIHNFFMFSISIM